MKRDMLRGLIPPLVTPFRADESVDWDILRREAVRLLDAGVHGLSLGGSTGEGALLSDGELADGIRAIREVNRNGLPVLCGVIRNATRDAIQTGFAAKAAGADALMVTPTYYHGTDVRGNAAFYREIYEAVGLPIVIYNVVKNNVIQPGDMPQLLENPGIAGIKQAAGGIHALADMLHVCGGRIAVFGAQDDVMYLSYAAGAAGAISAILTLFPRECVAQWNAVNAGDLETARALHNRMLPVWRTIEGGAFPGRIKTALRLIGVEVGDARRPILPTSEEEAGRIEAALRANGFLSTAGNK